LGLYISNVVIAHHHGTLQVQSQEGKGSTFVVTLPFESEAQADDAELSAA
jgi:signal transduction histidine kinase